MGMMRKTLKSFQADLLNRRGQLGQSGQAMVEYILMIVCALGVVAVMASGFRKGMIGIWGFYVRQTSAACPGCPANPNYRFR